MKDTLLAQALNVGNQQIKGPLDPSLQTLGDLVNRIISFIFPLAIVALFLVLVAGGFDYVTSQGRPEKLKSGQAKMTSGIIGFFILMFAYLAVKILTYVFGLSSTIF